MFQREVTQRPQRAAISDTKKAAPADSNILRAPTLSLPKGGGAISGIGEKFAANPVIGTGSMTVPIATSPSRSGFGPQLSLSYDSGAGNGPFGFGWSLSLPAITRKTDKGLPQYRDAEESDEYILSGAEDLVPVLGPDGKRFKDDTTAPGYTIHRYRPRIEGLFARIERWTNVATGEIHWRSISRDNITTLYGKDNNSRIFDTSDPDPAHPTRIYSWLICQSYDDKGNAIIYEYQSEDSQRIFEDQQGQLVALAHERNRNDATRSANRYLKRVKYGNRTPNRDATTWQATDPTQLSNETWMFEVVFDYGERHYAEDEPDADGRVFARALIDPPAGSHWPVRQDPFSTYRAGFEVRTYRRCRRVLMFHHFPQELGIIDCLVRSTEFSYIGSPAASFISNITQSGYVRQPIQNQPNRYLKRSLPPLEFEYSQVKSPEALARQPIREIDAESLENLPIGLDGTSYQWMDLDGEGTSGILTEQADGWYYKRNESANNLVREDGQEHTVAHFGPAEQVASKPAIGLVGGAQFLDLAGDGQVDLVQMEGPVRGFYERTEDASWAPFQPFVSWPNLSTRDPDLKFVDLTGDGHADILITEGEVLSWYPSLAEDGFGSAVRVSLPLEEEQGPRLVFSDGTQSIYLADMSGDGLTDLVRIRNGEVCYWPNLGYGHFGAKVTMDHAPWFDAPDQFDQRRIRLTDTDGSGTTDLLYLHREGVRIYFNQSGNGWSDAVSQPQFPPIDTISSVQVLDLLGNGTACLVWSSPLPGAARRPMRYLALMEEKPHLLVGVKNNLGAETKVHYAPSTRFYLDDKRDGKPWITRLPFTVHVVEHVETYDRISHNRFVTRYAYHHGYFDGVEREFRGFGMVEQWDTEEIGIVDPQTTTTEATNWDVASFVPPVLTRTWFHTGIYVGREHVSDFFAGLLDADDKGEYYREPGLTDEEARQLLLDDTVLPDVLTVEEQREACRALKGSLLRQEVYALDDTGSSAYPYGHPYTVTEQNFTIRLLQRQGTNRHAVFFTYAREAITYHYERNPADPRIQHALTLEVGEFGNALKSAAIGYGRREEIRIIDEQEGVKEIPNPDLNQLDPQDQARQTTTLISYTENGVSNSIDTTDDYRTPLPAETRTYQLTGYTPTGSAGRFQASDFVKPDPKDPDGQKQVHVFESEISYEEKPSNGEQRRLIEQVRTLYRKDDLTALLRFGEVGSLALPGESYKLAFTPGLLAHIYTRKRGSAPEESLLPSPKQVLSGTGSDRGGYQSSQDLRNQNLFPARSTDPLWTGSDADNHWWIPSGGIFYSPKRNVAFTDELVFARDHFFLPHCFRDPFGNETTVAYDGDTDPTRNHNLLLVETRDALSNVVTVKTEDDNGNIAIRNDYRVLQPYWVTDPNHNRTRVAFDALGMVVATAVMGKPTTSSQSAQGDSLDTFTDGDANPILVALQDFVKDPKTQARGLLKEATTRIVYDLDRFKRYGQPLFAATFAREIHVNDPNGGQSPIQMSFTYSDGFGREIQTKIQAESGDAPQRDPDILLSTGDIRPGDLVRDTNGKPVRAPAARRWVGKGRMVYNNKGKPVKQYEPFFSSTHLYEPEPEMTDTGVTPILFYDPVERVVATLHPHHAYEKVVFDPWRQETYDVNDTIAANGSETGDPRNDADIKGYVAEYFKVQPNTWQTWYQQRIAGTKGAQEKNAAEKAAKYTNTPTIAFFDTLGRIFMTVAHNRFERKKPDGTIGTTEEKYQTRIELDVEGNQRSVTDALLRKVMTYDYDILSNRVHQASMEAGERWILNDVMGKPIRAWDSRKFMRRMTFDALRRPIGLFVTENGNERLAEHTVYGENQGDANNHRTRVYQIFDGAGEVTNESYDFKGNLRQSKRELLPDYQLAVDWLQNPIANDGTFTTRTEYDALNRPLSITTPDGSVYRPTFNEANLLDKVEVNLRGAGTAKPFVSNIDYNAKGQRTLIHYANGAETTYEYDDQTFRLIHLKTTRPVVRNGLSSQLFTDTTIVQDLYYTYDPVGNITTIADDAIPTIQYNNGNVKPDAEYIYDAIYRLIFAHSREHIGQTAFDFNPLDCNYRDYPFVGLPAGPNDPKAVRNYSETYDYDEVGNIKSIRHSALNGSWTRAYTYSETSSLETGKNNNRLTCTQLGNGFNFTESYGYTDAQGNEVNGCMTSINSMQMRWDFKDQLQTVNLGGGGKAYYVYDASGQRVRKVINRQNGTKQKERIYLGGFEIYREYNGVGGTTPILERETLHIMDDKQRIALVETRTQGNDAAPQQLIRYQFGNHLGSASLELDTTGELISYEEYYPYGCTSYQAGRSVAEVNLKRYRYTDKEREEETGMYYYGARYYLPCLGRWISCDPLGADDGLNFFQFVRCNPINKRDSAGFRTTESEFARKFEIVPEKIRDPKVPNQVTRKEFAEILSLYRRIEADKTDIIILTSGMTKVEAEKFKSLVMEDIALILQTRPGRELVKYLAKHPKKEATSISLSQLSSVLVAELKQGRPLDWYEQAQSTLEKSLGSQKVKQALFSVGYFMGERKTSAMANISEGKISYDPAVNEIPLGGKDQPGYPIRHDIVLFHEMAHIYREETIESNVIGSDPLHPEKDPYPIATGPSLGGFNPYITENAYRIERNRLAGRKGSLPDDRMLLRKSHTAIHSENLKIVGGILAALLLIYSSEKK